MLYRADWLARLMTLLMLGMASLAAWPNLTSGDFAWPQASVGADSPANPLSYQENSAPRGGECVGYACFGQVANQAAGKLINEEKWSEGSAPALALHAVIGLAEGAISGGGNTGAALSSGAGAAAGTFTTAELDQYLWQDYLHGGSVRPDSAQGQAVVSLASAAIGAGVGALTGTGTSSGVGAVVGSSGAANSTLYNAEEDDDLRPDGPDGQPLTDQEIVDSHDYYAAYNALKALDPNNPAITTPYINAPGWIPSEQDAANMTQALVTAQELNTLNSTPAGQAILFANAPVGTETLAQADQAAISSGNLQALFRGTSEGYLGSPQLQSAGVTPTSTNPAVATVFGTYAQQYGNGVVQIALPGDIDEIDIIPGNVLANQESEVGVNMPPTQFANQASVTITTQQAQTILQNMGVSVPGNVASPGAISQILQETPPMSQAQIEEFITQAQGLTSGAAK